jgi:hypothetical protein
LKSASPSWCQAPIWDTWPIFFLLEIVFRQLQVCYFVAPSLMRERVCNLHQKATVITVTVLLSHQPMPTRRHLQQNCCAQSPQTVAGFSPYNSNRAQHTLLSLNYYITLFFFYKDPMYLQSVIIYSANGGKGKGCLVEEYSVALLC